MNKLKEQTIVKFHIGRGGRFNNQGHKTFEGRESWTNELNNLHLIDGEYYDDSGNSVGLTEDAVSQGIGILNYDNDYDTTICQYLSDCTEEEVRLIALSDDMNRNELLADYFEVPVEDIEWFEENADDFADDLIFFNGDKKIYKKLNR